MINKKVRWSGYLGTFHYALQRDKRKKRLNKGARGKCLADTFKGCTCPIVDSGKAPGDGWWCTLKLLWRQRQAAARAEANSASITNTSTLNRRKLCHVLQADLQRTQNPLWSCLSVILWGGFEWNLRGRTIPQEICTLFLKIHSGSERQQLDAPGGCSSLDFKGQLGSAWQWPGIFPILCSQYASEGRAAAREGLFQALSCSRHPTRCQSPWWFCAHGHLLPEPWAGACRLALHGCLVLIRQHLCLFFFFLQTRPERSCWKSRWNVEP